MAKPGKNGLSPSDCVWSLPEPRLDSSETGPADDLRRIELRRSALAIADLNPVAESLLVRAVAEHVRNDMPMT